ncbi:MAG TPA: trypsin-like peptidase domain-containing protein [Terriglobales bacterium]|jgi:S1-C subfamily serine protease|nr:trypsin-like peptidase domain-containing protein [Terriglobales bacterium]
MKTLRPILVALILAAGFFWITTYHRAHENGTPPPPATAANIEVTEAAGPTAFDPEEQTNIAVYKKALPAVVNIISTQVSYDFFYGAVPEQGQGSGFILDKEGHILTNYHVVQGAKQIEVTLANRRKYPARVVGTDPSHDLAVLQISASGLVPVTLGDSSRLQVGQKVFAIGNPFGLAGTMTRGIVSSIRSVRSPEGAFIDEAIQTDAAINPGNSGGPLLDSRGDVIGIDTMIMGAAAQSSGIGFAIPINTAKAVLNDLVTLGRVRRPALGIRTLAIGPDLAGQMGLPSDYGVLIVQAVPGGAAEKAGLHGGNQRAYIGNIPILVGGDLIVAIDRQKIEDTTDISRVMNQHRAGDKVNVTIYRGKQKMDVPVVLGELPQERN